MFSVQEVQSLNALETEVYNYVIANYSKVYYMRIRELAAEAHVSTTTVLRFCKKMGCNGFSEFKVELKNYFDRQQNRELNIDVGESIDFLKKSMSDEFEAKIAAFADEILKATKVTFLGSGSSGLMALYGARYLSSIGRFCLGIDDPHYPTRNLFFDDGVIIVLSVSGESSDIISHIKRFKEKNCKILSITNSESSTVAKLSDMNISYYTSMLRVGEYDISSQLPVLSIIERIGKHIYNATNTK